MTMEELQGKRHSEVSTVRERGHKWERLAKWNGNKEINRIREHIKDGEDRKVNLTYIIREPEEEK